jgi:TusA-related sulfurtransferase
MENIKYIDITQLPADLWQDAKNIIALDANGKVIKAEKEDSYSKEEIDELINENKPKNLKWSTNTDYIVTQPTVSGNSLVITDVVSDKNKYHTFGFNKTTKGTVFVPKDINITRRYDGVPEMETDIEDYIEFNVYENGGEVYATMGGYIPLELDKINELTNILHYEVSYVERDSENNVIGSGEQVIADVIYDPMTKLLSVPDGGFSFAQIIRTDTETYIFGGGTDGSEFLENGRWYYNFEQNPLEEGASLIWIPYYSSNLFWNYSVTINNIFSGEGDVTTDDKPHLLNDYIRYENEKAYILTDKNFQNVIKEWVGTQEEYDALETKDNNTTYYITE